MEMEESGQPSSGAVEMPTSEHSDVVENAKVVLRNGSVQVLEALWRTEASECQRGYDCWTVGLVSWPTNRCDLSTTFPFEIMF
jgi:hypothetical protein